MPKPKAVIDYQECFPENCSEGICQAAFACERRVIWQEEAHQPPIIFSEKCLSCRDCLVACPQQAIRIVS
jgi:Fe-S-cluster-containing hydrogenase component 2